MTLDKQIEVISVIVDTCTKSVEIQAKDVEVILWKWNVSTVHCLSYRVKSTFQTNTPPYFSVVRWGYNKNRFFPLNDFESLERIVTIYRTDEIANKFVCYEMKAVTFSTNPYSVQFLYNTMEWNFIVILLGFHCKIGSLYMFVCLIWFFEQFFSYVGVGLPGLNQY